MNSLLFSNTVNRDYQRDLIRHRLQDACAEQAKAEIAAYGIDPASDDLTDEQEDALYNLREANRKVAALEEALYGDSQEEILTEGTYARHR